MAMKKYMKMIETFRKPNNIKHVDVLAIISRMSDSDLWESKESFSFVFKNGKIINKSRTIVKIREPTKYTPRINDEYKDITKINVIIDDISETEVEE